LNNVATDANGSIRISSLDGKRIFDISCNLPAVICLSFDANGTDKWLKFIDANTFNPINSVTISIVVVRYFN
jgi:hypothetical protein